MEKKEEKSKKVIIQDIEFNLDGAKNWKEKDFLKTFEAKKKKAEGKGRFGRFDVKKGWESLQVAIKK